MYPLISTSVAADENHFLVDLSLACTGFASPLGLGATHFRFSLATLDDVSERGTRSFFSLLVLAINSEEAG